ncbi:hypothetical protein GHT06_003802 [Daphnia sinensis]|uniref:Uncharacterized protein n=1 Tax=Daphnia sinensis TaxID=1820382 RepID=A0AAD5PJZ6_9CRUS|nr:hypothetical protein GHT06_003802 [Daphnia sinensis]
MAAMSIDTLRSKLMHMSRDDIVYIADIYGHIAMPQRATLTVWLSLEDICRSPELFTYTRNTHVYGCDAKTLAGYIETSGNLRDPFANMEFSDEELACLDEMTNFSHMLSVRKRVGVLAKTKSANTTTHDAQVLVVSIIEDITVRLAETLTQLQGVNPYSRSALEAQVISTNLLDELSAVCSQSSLQFQSLVLRTLDQARERK